MMKINTINLKARFFTCNLPLNGYNTSHVLLLLIIAAWVAKLVDAVDSKSTAFGCVGSSPTLGTTNKQYEKTKADNNVGFFYIYIYYTQNNTKRPKDHSPLNHGCTLSGVRLLDLLLFYLLR